MNEGIGKLAGFAGLIIVSVGVLISSYGCVNINTAPPVANGYVFLDGHAVSGATVVAISANGTDHQYATTDDMGAFVLNITPGILRVMAAIR